MSEAEAHSKDAILTLISHSVKGYEPYSLILKPLQLHVSLCIGYCEEMQHEGYVKLKPWKAVFIGNQTVTITPLGNAFLAEGGYWGSLGNQEMTGQKKL